MDKKIVRKFVIVDWVDSAVEHGWQSEEPISEPLRCKSAGWLMHDGDSCKVISAHISEAGGYIDPMTIPIGCIRKIRVVKELKDQGW